MPCACLPVQSRIAEQVRGADFSIHREKKKNIYFKCKSQCDIPSVPCTPQQSSRGLVSPRKEWLPCWRDRILKINTQCWAAAAQLTWRISGRNTPDDFIYCSWLGVGKKSMTKKKKNPKQLHMTPVSTSGGWAFCFSLLSSIMSGNFPHHSLLAQFEHTHTHAHIDE